VARKHQFSAVFLVAAAAALAGTAAAQTTSGLEEIIVTAQKREQSMQDVGIAVTAFGDKQIRELGFTDSTDIVAMTPGLIYTTPNAESSVINFFLRGVGLNDFADANENPVAVYVDDVYRPASGGLSFQLFDLQRVEVLRGPQGTLFGRNTTGGLVHFISKRPTDELDGYVDLTYGSYNQIKAEAAFGGPIGDTVSGRLSAAMNKSDGWTENRCCDPSAGEPDFNAPDYNEGDSVAVRGQLQWEPSDAARILLSGNYSDNDATVGAWQHQATTRDGERRERAAGTERNDRGDRLQCGSCAGRRRSADGYRLLRLPRHGRRPVCRRLRPRRARRNRGLRWVAQHRLGRRRRHDHLDHGLPEGRAPAVRGHRGEPLPAHPADFRRGNEDFHAGAARGRRQRRVSLARRRVLFRQPRSTVTTSST
jgi:outer membrane receptor protein involved in Fe transport